MKPALFLWRGCALVIGTRIASHPHNHYAAQISYGIHGPFRARLQPDAPWESTRAAIFGPNQPHEIDGGDSLLAHLFLEVKHCPTELHAAFAGQAGFGLVQQAIARVDDPAATSLLLAEAASAVNAWRNCIPALAPTPNTIPKTNTNRTTNPEIDSSQDSGTSQGTSQGTGSGKDTGQETNYNTKPNSRKGNKGAQRIATALAYIEQHPQAKPDGAKLAQLVHLSASRFTHLFRTETGLTLSRYLLWTRLLAAIDAIATGQNMTQAAHAAGFADSPHMSRSFRHVFGITPSELLKMTIAFKRSH